jgi:hypothetical protein
MKKLLLILAISVSAVMADVSPKDDLLSVATAGKTTGTQFEMSKEDMQKADGGYYYINSYGSLYYNNYSSRSSNFSSYNSYYSNPSSSSYRGTSRSYIYASSFWN